MVEPIGRGDGGPFSKKGLGECQIDQKIGW